jgi:membrane protease YdiL (CAAX protease family)
MESSRSLILRGWQRLPVLVRSVVSGFLVFEVLQVGWMGCLIANTKVLPSVPWNVPAGLLFLWIVFRYFNGRGWPASTAAERRTAMRAGGLSRRQWIWSLIYCALCLVFTASIINVVYRFIAAPEAGLMDLSMFPWWTLYPSLVMLSINAGVSEEAGFRGYMQGGLERRLGPVFAVVFTSVVFWIAHLNHPNGMARGVLLIGSGVALGALAWAVQSIWPSIIAHAAVNAVYFTTVAGDFGPDYFMKKPPPFAETGIDTPFIVFSVLLVGSILCGIAVIRRLRQSFPNT